MNKKHILFIVNPHSGTGRYKKIEKYIHTYLDLKIFTYEIVYTRYKHHASELAKKAVEAKTDIIVAVGGDGTINEIVRVVVYTDCVLGIVPGGSGNGLAYHLHIPMSIKKAIQIINEMHIEKIDTVSLNQEIYTSMAGIGFDAFIAEKFDVHHKRGFFSYLQLILKYLFSYKSKTYMIKQGERYIIQKAFLVCFANSSQWGFNVKISPESSVQDGYINVCFVKKPMLISLTYLIMFLLSGNLNKVVRYVKIYKLKEFMVQTTPVEAMPIHIDGDPLERQDIIEIKTNPLSLNILLHTNI